MGRTVDKLVDDSNNLPGMQEDGKVLRVPLESYIGVFGHIVITIKKVIQYNLSTVKR